MLRLYGRNNTALALVKRYFKLNWPEIHLYDAMFNTETGDSFVAKMLARCVQQVARRQSSSPNSLCGAKNAKIV
jgi:hypothetical protein